MLMTLTPDSQIQNSLFSIIENNERSLTSLIFTVNAIAAKFDKETISSLPQKLSES